MNEKLDRSRRKIAARIEEELRAKRDREPFVSEMAEQYISERLAATGQTAGMQVVAEWMAAVEQLDLSALVAQIETDSSGNPLTHTPEQRRARAVWSEVNDLTQRAATWRRIFTLASEGRSETPIVAQIAILSELVERGPILGSDDPYVMRRRWLREAQIEGKWTAAELAESLGLTADEVERIWDEAASQ